MDYFTKLFKYHTADYTFADSVKAEIYDDLLISFSNIADLLHI